MDEAQGLHRLDCADGPGVLWGVDVGQDRGEAMTKPKQAQPVKKTAKNKGNPNLGPGPGRPKGSPNKVTKAIKDAAIGALNAGDGAEAFFLERKTNDPNAFMTFVKSLVPLDVTVGDPEGKPLVINILPVKPND
jgi:hypothetical protein